MNANSTPQHAQSERAAANDDIELQGQHDQQPKPQQPAKPPPTFMDLLRDPYSHPSHRSCPPPLFRRCPSVMTSVLVLLTIVLFTGSICLLVFREQTKKPAEGENSSLGLIYMLAGLAGVITSTVIGFLLLFSDGVVSLPVSPRLHTSFIVVLLLPVAFSAASLGLRGAINILFACAAWVLGASTLLAVLAAWEVLRRNWAGRGKGKL